MNYTDPSGMSTNYGHMWNQILKNTFHGFNHFTKGAMHSSNKWVRNAGNDASKIVFGKHHNDTWSSPYELRRTASFGIRLALGDPSLWLGLTVAALDLTLGNVINAIRGDPMAFIQYHTGGTSCVTLPLPGLAGAIQR